MGNLAGESWSDLVTRLKRYWTDAGCDPERLKEAVTHYRDDAGPKIRPARARGEGSDLPVARSLVSDNTILILFVTVFAAIDPLDRRVRDDLDRNTSADPGSTSFP